MIPAVCTARLPRAPAVNMVVELSQATTLNHRILNRGLVTLHTASCSCGVYITTSRSASSSSIDNYAVHKLDIEISPTHLHAGIMKWCWVGPQSYQSILRVNLLTVNKRANFLKIAISASI